MRKIETDGDPERLNRLLYRGSMSSMDLARWSGYKYQTVRKWSEHRGAPPHVVEKLEAHVEAVEEIWGKSLMD